MYDDVHMCVLSIRTEKKCKEDEGTQEDKDVDDADRGGGV